MGVTCADPYTTWGYPMRDFAGATTIATSPDQLFDYLADARHLPDYFPKALSATAGSGEDLTVVLDLDGEVVEVDAWYRVDRDRRFVQWGVPAAGFQGWLAVAADPAGSELTVSVQKPVRDSGYDEDAEDRTDAEIRDTILVIRSIMSRIAVQPAG